MTNTNKYYRAREEALLALVSIEEGLWAKEALDKFTDSGDKALSTEITYGTLQNKLLLDYILGFYLEYPLQKLTPQIRNILRSSLYQLQFLDRMPPKKVIYDAVRLAGRFGHKGVQRLVSGVLNSVLREKRWTLPEATLERLSIQYSHPLWLVKRWYQDLGVRETEDLLKWNNKRHDLCVRVNTLVTTPEEYSRVLTDLGIAFRVDPEIKQALYIAKSGSVLEMPHFSEGAIQPQSKASMLAAIALDPKPGEMITDLCAAPGTKTGYLAELMLNTGHITAIDLSLDRLDLAKKNLERLKVKNVEFLVADATQVNLPLQDRILVDVPCSGLGTLSHRPDARYHKTEASLLELPKLQLSILERAAYLLKPGGILVYSSCTTEKRENSNVIELFLKENNNFYEEEIPLIRGLYRDKYGYQSYSHKTDTDGFYYCRLRKR